MYRNLALALTATLMMLALCEGVLRLTYRGPWYARIEADQREAELAAYTRNAWGLRDREYGPKAPGVTRLMFFGDSFTFGSGVMDDRAIFPQLIEDATGFEILNGGSYRHATTTRLRSGTPSKPLRAVQWGGAC